MDSAACIGSLDELKATKGTLKRISILESLLKDPGFSRIVTAAYGETRFFMKLSLQGRAGMHERDTLRISDNEEFWWLLERMAGRELERKEVIELASDFGPCECELFCRVVNKDLRAGIGKATIEKALYGKKEKKTAAMLAQPYDSGRAKWPMWGEEKYDGMRCIITFSDGVRAFTRSGKEIHTAGDICKLVKELFKRKKKPELVDGELIGSSFKDTMSRARRKGCGDTCLNFVIFDVVWDGKTPFKKRRETLEILCGDLPERLSLSEGRMCECEKDAHALRDEVIGAGGEGCILKDLRGAYVGKRSFLWMKMKEDHTLDLPVEGVVLAEKGKYKGMMGALVVRNGDVLVKVGTGFSHADRKEIAEMFVEDCLPAMAEIGFQEETEKGSLRHPRFVCWREDK